MNLYCEEDLRKAQAEVRRYGLYLGAGLALFLAMYVVAILKFSEIVMLMILLAGLVFALPLGMLKLWPAMRYRNFVRDLLRGLRRESAGLVDFIEEQEQMQDGARVYGLQLRLEGGDTRIFYLNVSKAANFPEPGAKIKIGSFGRHICCFERVD